MTAQSQPLTTATADQMINLVTPMAQWKQPEPLEFVAVATQRFSFRLFDVQHLRVGACRRACDADAVAAVDEAVAGIDHSPGYLWAAAQALAGQ